MKGTLGERLSALMKERQMTQKELAIKAGVTEAAVSHYIKGDRCPRSSVLARLANVLGTTSDYLMGGDAQDSDEEIEFARRLIARNVSQMTTAQKRDILNILLGND
ncbi:MAG: helix-turn-helix domain-containing protein [Clostridiales bacterium]|nr:helix-turn-helix domain-containing protein [Clostridiales bacterium]